MTIRNPVSSPQNVWYNSQQVDDTDLTLEQNYNNTIVSAIVSNQIGTGILPEALEQNVIFNSSLQSGILDGVSIFAQNQPTDNNFGNQLQVSLSNSNAAGNQSVKLCIIGLDFENNLQFETFYFRNNEVQVGQKHFTEVLLLLFNDLLGDPLYSLNLGGQLIIQEATPFSLSRSPIMVSADTQPNLFFRDFFTEGGIPLLTLLQSALPLYNVNSLNINTSPLDYQYLLAGDIVTQIGQKFIAATNNIQKVTLLLAVRNQTPGQSTNLSWSGDLVVSIYPLQSTVSCPTDITPQLAIEFPPSNIPLAQISFNYSTLQSNGIILSSVAQPVDFVFSNSSVANGNNITPNSYYAVTVKRAGAASVCDIMIAVSSNTGTTSMVTTFSGGLWVDISDQNLWYRVFTDAAKVSSGQAYENGLGITLNKVTQDPTSLATIDYSLSGLQFVGGDVYHAVLSAETSETVPVPDQSTGQPILTRQQLVPNVTLYNTISLVNLETASSPLIIGAISDKNNDTTSSTSIYSNLYSATLIDNELLIKVVTNPSDPRYDVSVKLLETSLLNGQLVSAQIYPNANNIGTFYRIASAKIITSILGDVNGDGIIDINDLNLLNTYLGYNLNIGLPVDGYVNDGYMTTGETTFINGYETLISPFVQAFGLTFEIINPATNAILAHGVDGVLVPSPSSSSSAQFTSATVTFNTIVGLGSCQLVILTNTNLQNYGGFNITGLDAVADVISIDKIIISGDAFVQMFRADVNNDGHISYADGYLLESYIENSIITGTTTYAGPPTLPNTSIGTAFDIIRIKLEPFVDRDDDYSSVIVGRPQAIHILPGPNNDVFLNDGYFASHNFLVNPSPILIKTQLTWNEDLVVVNSQAKLLPAVYTSLSGFVNNANDFAGTSTGLYEAPPAFDPGRNDIFIPNNLIIGDGGEIQRADGYYYKVDFEIGAIILEIPDGIGSEQTINLLNDFIADYPTEGIGSGRTALGFSSMRFADGSYVTSDAIANDQIRFSVSIQSFSPNVNGLDPNGYYGDIVDGHIGIHLDPTTGLLTLNFANLYQDPILKTLNTKVIINVYLKKGGFNNQPLYVDSTKVQNMLGLINVFSGANEQANVALVNLAENVSGILPILNGGTGLNGVGVAGTVLTSNGSSLSYQFIADLIGGIGYSQGISSQGLLTVLDGYGKLDTTFITKNPEYIYGVSGNYSNGSNYLSSIGSLMFRFDNFIMGDWQSIQFEAIASITNSSNDGYVKLYNVTTNTYIATLTITSTTSTFLSTPIQTLLSSGAQNWVYEVHIGLATASATDVIICRMARVTIYYNNPYGASPSVANVYSSNFVPYLPTSLPT
jgi:hypothetical protein